MKHMWNAASVAETFKYSFLYYKDGKFERLHKLKVHCIRMD